MQGILETERLFLRKMTMGIAFYTAFDISHSPAIKYLAIPVCAVATFAAVQEGHFIRTNTDSK